MNIVIESLFQWDIKNQTSKGPGIFGTTVAFAPADEEQGRKTLHKHIQLWVKEIDHKLRARLFDNDSNVRNKARLQFQEYIDKIMCASYGVDLEIPTSSTVVKPESLYQDATSQQFRDARHEDLCVPIVGTVIQPKHRPGLISPDILLHQVLQHMSELALENTDDTRLDACIPPTREKLDQAAYLFSYHMPGGANQLNDVFWGDTRIRQILLTRRFDQHDYTHRAGCFKKGCECRFLFPFHTCPETYIHEDPGNDNENMVNWHQLFGTSQSIAPWMVVPKRPMGSQYINVHNHALSSILNCNTNVQVGDPFHMYYITLYNLKSTQEEDSERIKRVVETIVRRLVRIQDEVAQGLRDALQDNSFAEGLCRMLSGINAATSRYVVSATMAHLLISQGGTRFKFSHDMSDLLVTQLEACLEGKPVDFRLRVNKYKRETVIWRDCLADDYIHRPTQQLFENMCAYEMAMKYEKKYMSFQQMGKLDIPEVAEDDYDFSPVFRAQFKSESPLAFKESHPGFKFSYLWESKHIRIPKISLPKNRLCDIEALKIGENEVDDQTTQCREDYAKFALIMFYPYREIRNIKLHDSYWKLFMKEYHEHKHGRPTKFWKKGFEILQNIQDRLTLEKELKRARDPITIQTECKKNTSKSTGERPTDDYDDIPDILQFCPQR